MPKGKYHLNMQHILHTYKSFYYFFMARSLCFGVRKNNVEPQLDYIVRESCDYTTVCGTRVHREEILVKRMSEKRISSEKESFS